MVSPSFINSRSCALGSSSERAREAGSSGFGVGNGTKHQLRKSTSRPPFEASLDLKEELGCLFAAPRGE